jgi:ADP-ribose pyrophosphatase YjhB (NUDIX family)
MENPAVLMSKEEREKIIMLFAKVNTLSFSEIENATGLRSNHLVYFLKQLQEEALLQKSDDGYKITIAGQKLIPNMVHLTGKESPPLAVVIAMITDGDKICLLKREKRPFQGYWSLIGGKLKHSETIIEASVREAKEETGLDVELDHFCGFCHEHVKEKGEIKHSFLFMVCKMKVVGGKLKESDEGKVSWFDISSLRDEKVVQSDLWMVENMLNKKPGLHYSVMDDHDGNYIFEGNIY